jgi:hypothetical protein
VKTYAYQSVTLTSYTGGRESSKPVLSPFGPVRAGLTTKRARLTQKAIPDLVLSELLSYLEKESKILESKLSVVSNILNTDIKIRVERLVSTTAKTGIDTVLE